MKKNKYMWLVHYNYTFNVVNSNTIYGNGKFIYNSNTKRLKQTDIDNIDLHVKKVIKEIKSKIINDGYCIEEKDDCGTVDNICKLF